MLAPRRVALFKRATPLLAAFALSAACAFAQSPLIINTYYGSVSSTDTLSPLLTNNSSALKGFTAFTYAFAGSDGVSNPCTGLPTLLYASEVAQLRTVNRNMKILVSLGGENTTSVFEGATGANGANAKTFATTCVNTLMTDAASAGTSIDGIDIDWEYPTSSDVTSYVELMRDMRAALDAYAASHGISEHLLLTAAFGPLDGSNGWQYIDFTGKTDPPGVNSFADFYNVETYQYVNGPDGVTESNAPLPEIQADIFGNTNYYEASGLVPVGGAPTDKVVIGIPWYAVLFDNVTSGCSLGQPGTLEPSEPSYDALFGPSGIISGNPSAWEDSSCGNQEVLHDGEGSAWSWNSTAEQLYEFDDPTTIAQKITFVQNNNLGGVFAWNMQDDTPTGTLSSATNTSPAQNNTGYSDVSGSVSVTAPNGLAYNKLKKTYTETYVIKNTSGATISGPIELVVWELPQGATASNNTGFYTGSPYWTVTAGSLTPGASTQVAVTFSSTTATPIQATTSVFSGAF